MVKYTFSAYNSGATQVVFKYMRNSADPFGTPVKFFTGTENSVITGRLPEDIFGYFAAPVSTGITDTLLLKVTIEKFIPDSTLLE